MRFQFCAFSFLIILVSLNSYASISFDKELDCSQKLANGQTIAIKGPISLNQIMATGVIPLSGSSIRMIDFYGPLTLLNTAPMSSDHTTFAKLAGEIQGSIRITPAEDNNQYYLTIAVNQMGRAYDPNTRAQVFIIDAETSVFHFNCRP